MQYGYNVSQTEDLRAPVRQALLALLIDNRILTKNEVVSYLDFFISREEGRANLRLLSPSGRRTGNLSMGTGQAHLQSASPRNPQACLCAVRPARKHAAALIY